MEISTNAIYDRAKESWLENSREKHSTITFTDNINYITKNAKKDQIHFVIAKGLGSISPILCNDDKLLLNNGKNIPISEFIQFTDHNQKDFTDKSNWFNFDEFVSMVNKMNWISNVRVNQGDNGDLTMNINGFKKFVNTTFKMKFELSIDFILNFGQVMRKKHGMLKILNQH